MYASRILLPGAPTGDPTAFLLDKPICYLPGLLALSGCSFMATRGRLDHSGLLLRIKAKGSHCPPGPYQLSLPPSPTAPSVPPGLRPHGVWAPAVSSTRVCKPLVLGLKVCTTTPPTTCFEHGETWDSYSAWLAFQGAPEVLLPPFPRRGGYTHVPLTPLLKLFTSAVSFIPAFWRQVTSVGL